MLKLKVRLHGQNIQSLELADPATVYWAGRNESCQIPLKAESGLSRQHFKIFFKDDRWHLEVVSRYGQVQIGESSTRELELKEGVAFGLPPYDFSVESQQTIAIDENMALVSGSDVKARALVATGGPEEKTVTRAIQRGAQFVLQYRDPESKTDKLYVLTKDQYIIGRDASCDIVINDGRVSRRQFKLSHNKGQIWLEDYQGVNGTLINKTKVETKEAVAIKSGDKISVLSHKFSFEVRDPDFESKMEQVRQLALLNPELPPELQVPANSRMDGLSLVNSGNPYGQLQPVNSSGVPGPVLYDQQNSSYGHTSNASLNQGQIKTLNFWGLKIALTKENKMRLGLVGFLLIVLVFAANDDSSEFDPANEVAERPADPFSKLTPEEQKHVKVQYELAKDLYTKGNYQLAKEELGKVHAKIPSYLDSAELSRFIEVGIQSAQEREQQERLKREAAESEERIQNLVSFCRQQIKPTTTSVELEECLSAAILLNPEHELIVKVRDEVARVEEEQKTREAERLLHEAQVAELTKQFKLASEIGKKDPLKGIAAFNEFQKLTMPDPDKLQEKAKDEIRRLEQKIKLKVNAAISAVRGLVDSGKHKEAIIALEKASEVAPEDATLKEEIERITEELRKRMQALYQEAILEENIGNIETAKERWRKIIGNDIPNGEYFSKAKSKLKKYGGS
jgi:pSer/pThr/pTyr-binding forkhead associated (FHA) protein